jgi:EAL domain-containing protein (putative c-di-GMP-specific phosphodiesterase class I)
VVPIGMNILEQTCAQISAWQRQMPGLDLRAGVNFSARQLQQPTLVEEVAAALERNQLDPRHLIIEITESVFVRDPDDIADRLAQLSALGVSLAIDDFGTGYSSLSYLRRFPVKILKIDKFFIKGMDISPEESAYARAIVSLGHSLGLEVIAEGIESPGELEQLRDVQCDFGQGYMFAQPMTAPEFELLLMDRASVAASSRLVQPLAE